MNPWWNFSAQLSNQNLELPIDEVDSSAWSG